MSHVVECECKITDLKALEKACDKIGLAFKPGQKTYAWYGRFVGDYPLPAGVKKEDLGKCDHAIAMKVPVAGAYEIGVVKNKTDEAYSLRYDFFSQSNKIEKLAGPRCGELVMQYGCELTKSLARSQGYECSEVREKNGSLSVHVEVGA